MTNLNVPVTTNTKTTTPAPAPVSKLDAKLSEWIYQVKSRDLDYFAIVADNGNMYYVSGKNDSEIKSCDVLIDTGNGFERTLTYRKEEASSSVLPEPFLIIVKKEKKLIANNQGQIFGFGFKDSAGSNVKRLLIHFRQTSSHMLVTATNQAAYVDVTYSLVEDSVHDPLGDCLHALFASACHAQNEVRK